MTPGPPRGTSLQDLAEEAAGRGDGHSETPLDDRPRLGRARLAIHKRARSTLIVVGLVVLLAIPLMVALGVLRHPRWYPVADLAQTELRVRDVGTGHPPLIGLAGRFGPLGHQGSHPGPLSFWAMWPVYRLFGATSWAMQAAAVSLHLLAVGAIFWIAYRRAGLRLVLGLASVLAILVRAYGTVTLTEAWNPHLPVLWWLVFLLAAWSVICGDLLLLPVAVFAGSFCVQTHLPYTGLVIGLSGFTIAVAFFGAYARRQQPGAMRQFARWALLAAAVGLLVWLPPLIEQFTTSRGNLSVIRDEFLHPPETPVGLRRGIKVLLFHLNPWRLLAGSVGATTRSLPRATKGSLVPGLLLVAAWAVTVVVARRLRHRSLMRLHIVVAVALLLSVVSISRIHGLLWYYLVLWAWGINALMLLAIGWTLSVAVGRRLSGAIRRRAATTGSFALATVAVLSTALFAVDAAQAKAPEPRLSKTLGRLVPPTVRALDRRPGPDGGRNGRYLLTWADPVSIGAQGVGLLNELDRRGFDGGVIEIHGPGATTHRVLDPAKATAVVHLSIGPDIQTWRAKPGVPCSRCADDISRFQAEIQKWQAKPGVQLVAYVDPRSPQERAEYERLRSRAIRELQAAGLPDLVSAVDGNLFTTVLDPRLPKRTKDRLARMLALGLPAAVFVGPPGTQS
jgi:hypothetical protein